MITHCHKYTIKSIISLYMVCILLVQANYISIVSATSKINVITEYYDIKGHWAEDYIKKAIFAGLIRGTKDCFDPEGYFTIEDAMMMAVRVNNLPLRSNKLWESSCIPYAEAGDRLNLLLPRNVLVYGLEEWDKQLEASAFDFEINEDGKYYFELANLLKIAVNNIGYSQITNDHNLESLEYFLATSAMDMREGGMGSKITKGYMVEILNASINYRDNNLLEKSEREKRYKEEMIKLVEMCTNTNEEEFTGEHKKMVDLGMLAYWPQTLDCIGNGYLMEENNTIELMLTSITRAEACTIMVRFLNL